MPALKAGRILNLLVEINKGVTDNEADGPHWPEWRKKGAWQSAPRAGAHAEGTPGGVA